MTKFKTSYDSLEELYKSHLTKIKNIKFTFREIDLIACIISNKGEKKIASLCDISPRTVSSHVYNIMNKIGCNSKDQIIEFAEFSGKFLVFREYYLHLIVRSYFHKLLGKIGKVNKEGANFYITRSDEAKYSKLFLAMKKDLEIANINLQGASEKDSKNSPMVNISEANDSNYYSQTLKYVNEILGIKETENALVEFEKIFKDVEDMYDGRKEKIPSKTHRPISFKKYLWIMIILLGGSIAALLFSEKLTGPKIISQNTDFTQEFISLLEDSEITADNTSKDSITKNHSLIKKIEKIVEYSSYPEIKEYLNNAEMESETITNYMHVLQALASYNMYNRHDGEEAKRILLIAKNAAENYINSRTNLKLNFNELSPSEILSEMQVVKHMPELYTRVLYSLARTYFYIEGAKHIEKSRPYFSKAKYLGENLNLFEGYLSDISGILLLDRKKSQSLTSDKIYQIIGNYKQLRDSDKEYILDFNPKIEEQAKIVPSKNIYNILTCQSFIMELYITLMKNLDGDFDKYSEEFIEILRNYIKPDINFLNGKVPQKKLAGLYNILGEALILMDKKLSLKDHTVNVFQKILDSKSEDLSEFAEILFEKSVSLSRNADYTKADALDGLYRINLSKLDNDKLSQDQRLKIEEKLSKYKQKQDIINESLKRKKP